MQPLRSPHTTTRTRGYTVVLKCTTAWGVNPTGDTSSPRLSAFSRTNVPVYVQERLFKARQLPCLCYRVQVLRKRLVGIACCQASLPSSSRMYLGPIRLVEFLHCTVAFTLVPSGSTHAPRISTPPSPTCPVCERSKPWLPSTSMACISYLPDVTGQNESRSIEKKN